jgi:serine protease Do
MTVGFVSALGRSLPVQSGAMLQASYTIPDIVQTDAPINPGNSGGVLVNDEGRVIGVPTAIESPVGANAGIGFAVPSAIVQKVVPALIRDGSYAHPWLGISGTSLTANLAEAMALDTDERGVLVIDVVAEGPAAQAGLQGSGEEVDVDGLSARVGGDLIVAIDGEPIDEFEDLVTYLARYTSVGQTIELTILREGREEAAQVTLAARPAEEEAQVVPQVMPDTVPTGGAWLGIRGQTVTPEIAEAMELPSDQQGVLVQEVIGDTPADEAGLLGSNQIIDVNGQQVAVGGDIIVALEGQPVEGFEDLRAELAEAQPGQRVELGLLREGADTVVNVTLGERPATIP